MDVKTMCLDHDLHEDFYMTQQLGFYGYRKKMICKFRKAFSAWHKCVNHF
jgi:hypothetical protein